jgi:hypothetical protein
LFGGTACALCAFKEPAQNGHAEAASIDGFLACSAARLCALCAFEERAQNGHAEAASIDGFRTCSAARLCALCAFEEHAQNGHGVKRPTERASEFLSSLAARSRALWAFSQR